MTKLLLIDDDPLIRKSCGRYLQRFLGMEITEATTGLEALARLSEGDFDIVVSDVSMPEMNGVELFQTLQAKRPDVLSKFVFHTAEPERVRSLGRPVIDKGSLTQLAALKNGVRS